MFSLYTTNDSDVISPKDEVLTQGQDTQFASNYSSSYPVFTSHMSSTETAPLQMTGLAKSSIHARVPEIPPA